MVFHNSNAISLYIDPQKINPNNICCKSSAWHQTAIATRNTQNAHNAQHQHTMTTISDTKFNLICEFSDLMMLKTTRKHFYASFTKPSVFQFLKSVILIIIYFLCSLLSIVFCPTINFTATIVSHKTPLKCWL